MPNKDNVVNPAAGGYLERPAPDERPSVDPRERAYFRYLIDRGCVWRWGPGWETPERLERIAREQAVIEHQEFESYFIILAKILDHCRDKNIPYGPGRGSVGGCLIAFLMGIHEIDSLEFDLLFERFLNEDRVAYPDIDIDVSQRHRPKVLQWIQESFAKDGNVVLQVAAFSRFGGRAVIDQMLAARGQDDPQAGAIAENLKKCLPKGSLSAGVKHDRELAWWIDNGHGDPDRFKELAIQAGWLDDMLKLDGLYSHLAKHAAGVVILSQKDLENLPLCSTDGEQMMTGFDMYSLDVLKYLKIDLLGLRTLDVIADAHKAIGGSGSTEDIMEIWREHRDDPDPYPLLCEGDTMGIFQMETGGYRRTLKDFEPDRFDHIVQLNALYRPGALGYHRPEDGKNMVEVFIERRHLREQPNYPHPLLEPVLRSTHGVLLYQEQSMKTAQVLAGFDLKQADALRKAIGKKLRKDMDVLLPQFIAGCAERGVEPAIAESVAKNIDASARYAWNLSHSVEYGAITWCTAWFKAPHEPDSLRVQEELAWEHSTAGFYVGLLNSYGGDDTKSGDAERLSEAIAEARQKVDIRPPDINIAEDGFVMSPEGEIVFGFKGVKGMGAANRNEILCERFLNGPFKSFEDFCDRLPSVPISMKKSLIACGAFDGLGMARSVLLAQVQKVKSEKQWTVADHINHNRKLKTRRPVPELWEMVFPTDRELAEAEHDVIGFYISKTPLEHVSVALARCSKANTWGGEIQAITRKTDKNGNAMANFTLLTPALTKTRCVMFASVYTKFADHLVKGAQVLLRGREDGTSILVDAVWALDDIRHFAKLSIQNGHDAEQRKIDKTRGIEQVVELEQQGFQVKLL